MGNSASQEPAFVAAKDRHPRLRAIWSFIASGKGFAFAYFIVCALGEAVYEQEVGLSFAFVLASAWVLHAHVEERRADLARAAMIAWRSLAEKLRDAEIDKPKPMDWTVFCDRVADGVPTKQRENVRLALDLAIAPQIHAVAGAE